MDLKKLKDNWEDLGVSDAYWAVLSNADKINNQWDLKEFYKSGEGFINQLFKSLKLDELIVNKKDALDFGCGPGRLTQALCKHFRHVKGVDISSTMIEKAKAYNKFPNRCKYYENSSDDLSQFETASFDLVFSFITLQHIQKKYAINYIKEFARVAKKGGHIFFNIPYKQPFAMGLISSLVGQKGLNVFRRFYYKKKSVIEMHCIKEEELRQLFKELNLDVIKITPDKGVGENWGSNMYLLQKQNNYTNIPFYKKPIIT